MNLPTYQQIVDWDERMRMKIIRTMDKENGIPECTTFLSFVWLWSAMLGLSGTYLLWRPGSQTGFWVAIIMSTLSGAMLLQVVPLGSNPREPL